MCHGHPHRGEYKPPSWTFHDIDPEEFCLRARAWVERGVQIVGGCCGIRPHHIHRLHEVLSAAGR